MSSCRVVVEIAPSSNCHYVLPISVLIDGQSPEHPRAPRQSPAGTVLSSIICCIRLILGALEQGTVEVHPKRLTLLVPRHATRDKRAATCSLPVRSNDAGTPEIAQAHASIRRTPVLVSLGRSPLIGVVPPTDRICDAGPCGSHIALRRVLCREPPCSPRRSRPRKVKHGVRRNRGSGARVQDHAIVYLCNASLQRSRV
jgi:hypothetical protein